MSISTNSSSFDNILRPHACSICRLVMLPGRSSTGAPRVQSTMVDSMPSWQGPPSRINKSAPNSSSTCAAVVGLTRPKRLALGAAMPQTSGTPCAGLRSASSTACAPGCDGQRIPMESCPPAAAAPTPGLRGKIRVSGPGQKADMSCWAKGGTCPQKCATPDMPPSNAATCTMSGWSAGRPLAANILATAVSLDASAPKP